MKTKRFIKNVIYGTISIATLSACSVSTNIYFRSSPTIVKEVKQADASNSKETVPTKQAN